jgi:hypothetical protein
MRTAPALALLWLLPLPGGAAPARDPVIDGIVRDISAANIEATVRKLAGFRTRHTLSDPTSDERGIGAARRWIKGELDRYSREAGGRLKVELDEFITPASRRVARPTPLVNVVATLPGTQKESSDRLYVVSGHYDSRASDVEDAQSDAPGADDDASGVAAVMELARVMSKRSFDATLVFLAVAGEEQDLLGSGHWAAAAAERKLAVAGMITNDIIGNTRAADGRVDRTHVRLFAEGVAASDRSPQTLALLRTGGENDGPTRQLARAIKELGERYVAGMTVNVIYRRDRYLRSGDHGPFLDRGFAAVRLTEPAEDYRHQHQNVRTEGGVSYGDTALLVDFGYVAQVARVDAAALAALALAPATPAQVELETARLENDATLLWQPNREPDLAGYRIVWRETTAPFWQDHVDVGKVTRYTMKGLSKDNVIFGVQALDTAGHASPAAYPRPSRTP